MRFPRPCLVCNRLHTDSGDYCASCRSEINAKREANPKRKQYKKNLYNAEYQRLSKIVRANAIICHICSKGANPNDPWTADHIIPGDINSPLAPAHRSCNSRKGNRTHG